MSKLLPLRACAQCGHDCDWCIGANEARVAFPRATKPPFHDADHDKPEEHSCIACFEKKAMEMIAKGEPGASMITCGKSALGEEP